MGRISAVVVNWNGGELLERCLASLEAQDEPFSEIVVVDNASADGSVERCRKRYPRVRWLSMGWNAGFAAAANAGVEAADADLVALVNPDAWLDSGWTAAMKRAASASGAAVAAFASVLRDARRPHVLDGAGDAYHISGRAWRLGRGRSLRELSLEPREVFSACAAAAVYRREAFTEAGGFDERFFCYMEDVDLGFRLRLRGWRAILVPEAVAYHVGAYSTGGQHSEFAVYHGHRNMVWVFVKNMPAPLLVALFPGHMLINVVAVAWLAALGKGRAAVRAKVDALRGLKQIWRQRREVQAGMRSSVVEIWRALDKGWQIW